MTLIDSAIAYCLDHTLAFSLDYFKGERTLTVKGADHNVEMMEDAGVVYAFTVRGDVVESIGPFGGLAALSALAQEVEALI